MTVRNVALYEVREGGHVKDKELRRRCEEVVGRLEFPDPFDVHQLCRLLGEQRGRPIHLTPLPLPANSPCGLIVSTDTFDAIFYQANTSRLHQEHIIAHELGHLLGGHQPVTGLGTELSETLLPNLNPQLIQRVLGRTGYAAVEEREAELIASLISRAANTPQSVSTWVAPPELAEDFDRIGGVLENDFKRGRRRG